MQAMSLLRHAVIAAGIIGVGDVAEKLVPMASATQFYKFVLACTTTLLPVVPAEYQAHLHFLLGRHIKPRSPSPRTARVAGSGTGVTVMFKESEICVILPPSAM